MRAEYFRLSEKGLGDAELLGKLRESYQVMLNRTDPLQKHRGDKIAKQWDCPKVCGASAARLTQQANCFVAFESRLVIS